MFQTTHLNNPDTSMVAQRMRLNSKLKDLETFDFQIDEICIGEELFKAFERDALLPGAILTSQGKLTGFISRTKFLEILSLPYSRELFLKRELRKLHTTYPIFCKDFTILSSNIPIFEAVRTCLQRQYETLYEPIVVNMGQQAYRIVALQDLLLAQSQTYQAAMLTIEDRNAAILEQNDKLQQYIQQVERMTAAAIAVEQDIFEVGHLSHIAIRTDELGRLARVFQHMFQTIKLRERELEIAEENYRSIFENALEGIFQTSPEGHYINVNPALAKIYGYESPVEMIACVTNIAEQVYVEPDERQAFMNLINQQSVVKEFEYQSYRKDGTIIWTQVDARAVKDSEGKLLYYEGIVQDITDRKHREDGLKQQLAELKIEIDQTKRKKEVTLLTESDYFQEIQQEIATMDLDQFWLG